MFYKYRDSDNRVASAGREQLTAGEGHSVIELGDETAYLDPSKAYRITSDLAGVEVDITDSPNVYFTTDCSK